MNGRQTYHWSEICAYFMNQLGLKEAVINDDTISTMQPCIVNVLGVENGVHIKLLSQQEARETLQLLNFQQGGLGH